MKLLKKISALIVGMSIFGSMAFAAESVNLTVTKYAEGDKSVVVSLLVEDIAVVMGSSSINVEYDADIFTLNAADAEDSQTVPNIYAATYELKDATPTLDGYTGCVNWSEAAFTDMTITEEKGNALFTLEFLVNEGKNPVGAKFAMSAQGIMNGETFTLYETDGVSVTVESDTPAGPSVTAGSDVNGVTEYTFANSDSMSGKKVLMTTTATAGNTITEDTRFYVSYQSGEERIFGSDIWDKLAQGGGSITVNNVKFGIIVSEGMSASDFTFDVR